METTALPPLGLSARSLWRGFGAALATLAATGVAFAAPQGDGQWPSAARDPENTRYSDLAQISTANVKSLRLAFTFPLGVERGQEAAPIVVGDTMYVVTPYPEQPLSPWTWPRAGAP